MTQGQKPLKISLGCLDPCFQPPNIHLTKELYNKFMIQHGVILLSPLPIQEFNMPTMHVELFNMAIMNNDVNHEIVITRQMLKIETLF